MIISKTPLRVSFFGGGTDFPAYFEREKGAVIGTTIDKYVYVSVNKSSQFFEYNYRVSYSKAELVKKIDEIIHPSVRETLKYRKIKDGLDIHIFTDLPAKTGLGSSSSFTAGFLNALYAYDGKTIPKKKLAEQAIYIEQKMIKENVGSQDQVHAAYGGFNIIKFSKTGFSVKPVMISKEKLNALESSLVCFYTGQTRYATEVLKEQIQNIKSYNKDKYLEKMYGLVFEAQKIISGDSNAGMVEDFGKLLHENWNLKKNLSTMISNRLIDDIYEAGMNAGAYGGKIMGAGNGGFMLFVAAKNKQNKIRQALKKLLELKIKFENKGSHILYVTK